MILHLLLRDIHDRPVAFRNAVFQRLLRVGERAEELACFHLARREMEARARLLLELERGVVLLDALVEISGEPGFERLTRESKSFGAVPTRNFSACCCRSRGGCRVVGSAACRSAPVAGIAFCASANCARMLGRRSAELGSFARSRSCCSAFVKLAFASSTFAELRRDHAEADIGLRLRKYGATARGFFLLHLSRTSSNFFFASA